MNTGVTDPTSYWGILQKTWAANRISGCTCEFCHGTDICTIQQCWNTFYGAKLATNGSSSQWSRAKAASVSGQRTTAPMDCVVCKETNEYAEPNRADGTYCCYACRK